MPSVSVERLPVQLLGLGYLGFDHLQIVFQPETPGAAQQDGWFVIEGLREQDRAGVRLAVEGWHGGTTLSDANGGLAGEELAHKIGTSATRGAHEIASGSEAVSMWATLVSFAADFEAQRLPYIPMALASSMLPTINSSSLVASLLHHAGVPVEDALPSGLRFSPGMSTLIGTSRDDTLAARHGFSTLIAGGGNDLLIGGEDTRTVDKLYGGAGDDTFRWSRGENVLHGGQPGLAYADDGIDTVDYSGAGEIRIDALSPGAPHVQADFLVTHPGGQDRLFSIEEILWDSGRDRVTLGTGVGLAAPPTDPVDASADGEARESEAALRSAGTILLAPSAAPADFPELGLIDTSAHFAPLGDVVDGLSLLAPLDILAGG